MEYIGSLEFNRPILIEVFFDTLEVKIIRVLLSLYLL